jgi:hypothetical protein
MLTTIVADIVIDANGKMHDLDGIVLDRDQTPAELNLLLSGEPLVIEDGHPYATSEDVAGEIDFAVDSEEAELNDAAALAPAITTPPKPTIAQILTDDHACMTVHNYLEEIRDKNGIYVADVLTRELLYDVIAKLRSVNFSLDHIRETLAKD